MHWILPGVFVVGGDLKPGAVVNRRPRIFRNAHDV
jgi:hypothetical protein